MPAKTLIYLSAHDPRNVLNWSGTLFALSEALERNDAGVQIRYLHGGWSDSVAHQINRVIYKLGFKFDCRHSTIFSICSGLELSIRLKFLPPGPILSVGACNYVPYIKTSRPIVYITDGPFRASARIYPYYSKELPAWLFKQFDRNEGLTLRRAKAVIVPSQWAAESAKSDYGVPADRIFQLPFGANIPADIVNKFYAAKTGPGSELNLLMVSADWQRKGGDKAIAICRALIERGIGVRFVVIGKSPDDIRQLPFVDARGFVKKTEQAGLEEICAAYRDADFFILPTIADAAPIVFSECYAFGLPPITHDVGGTQSVLDRGRLGLLLPLDASPHQFVDAMLPYVRDRVLYRELSRKCRKWYLEQAQWRRWQELIFTLTGLANDRRPQQTAAREETAE